MAGPFEADQWVNICRIEELAMMSRRKHPRCRQRRKSRSVGVLPTVMVILVAGLSMAGPAGAHETDQYTIPVGRTFADLGPYFSRWVYQSIDRGCAKVNRRIEQHMRATGSDRGRPQDYDAQTLADAVNTSFPWAMDVIEGLESYVKSTEAWQRYPGRVVGYKRKLGNYLQHIHLPVDPRQFFRLWLASTVRVYGHYVGTDKIGHFTDMGKNYFDAYQAARRKGLDESQALSAALDIGRKGLFFSETGVLGYLSAGAYSNGDMIANYMGMLFYRNLTEPVTLQGRRYPPLLVRDGPFWKPAPGVAPDTDFMRPFFSDHWDEALNPSHYESGMRQAVRRAVRDRSTGLLERYRDVNGCRRPRQWFEQKTRELTTYFGADYGQRGTMEDRITLSRVCYAGPPDDAGPDRRDWLGFNRLHHAAMNGQARLVAQLLEAGWPVDAAVRSHEPMSSDWGNTPLHLAVRSGHRAVAEILLQAGAPVNRANDAGATPLHYATARPDMVQLLLNHGAKVDARDGRGRTPLHWAAAYGADRSVALLLKATAPVDAADHDRRTALHRAARFGKIAVIEQLLAAGAAVNASDRFGRTPLHLAARAGQAEAVAALLAGGAAVRAADAFGRQGLHEAASFARLAVARMLLKAGAPVDATDCMGSTPLHLAARHGQVSLVRLLVEHGARVDAVNALGATALHEAAASGCRWTASALLAAGSDDEVRDRLGRTALEIARAGRHRDVVAVLQSPPNRGQGPG